MLPALVIVIIFDKNFRTLILPQGNMYIRTTEITFFGVFLNATNSLLTLICGKKPGNAFENNYLSPHQL